MIRYSNTGNMGDFGAKRKRASRGSFRGYLDHSSPRKPSMGDGFLDTLATTLENTGAQIIDQAPGVAEGALSQQLQNTPAVQAQLAAQAQAAALKQTAAAQLSALNSLQASYTKYKTYIWLSGAAAIVGVMILLKRK